MAKTKSKKEESPPNGLEFKVSNATWERFLDWVIEADQQLREEMGEEAYLKFMAEDDSPERGK